jgi:DNA polymerase-1
MHEKSDNSLYVLDASGYLYRSYFAIRNMTNAKGESTNALFGFLRSLQKLRKDFSPRYLVAVFDGPRSIHRRVQMYSEYKAHRAAMPADLRYQISWAQQACQLMHIPFLAIPDVEADDTMGTIAQRDDKKWDHVYLCTSDKDLSQLVNEKISVLNTFKENQILGPVEIEQTFGVPPEKMVDFLAMVGDTSDNIPGLPGVGPKTAASWLKEFGSLDKILAHPEKLPAKKAEMISQNRELVQLSRALVTVHTDVEVPSEKEFFAIGQGDFELLKTFYASMNFHSLIREMEGSISLSTKKESVQKEEVISAQYHLVDDSESLEALLALLKNQHKIYLSIQGNDPQPLKSECIGIALCIDETHAWYLPARGHLGLKEILENLKIFFEEERISWCGHNIKYDLQILATHGIFLKNVGFDTMLASYLLSSHTRQHTLDHLMLEYYGVVTQTLEEVTGKGKTALSIWEVDHQQLLSYFCKKVLNIHQLHILFTKHLQERGLQTLFNSLELPLIHVLGEVERNGMYLDVPHLKQMSVDFLQKIHLLEEEVYLLAGEKFNLNSPKQLSQILYEKLQIKPPKKTATGLSTNADVLEILKASHPIAEKILEYRSLEKLRSTYVDALPLEVFPKTRRIHCTLNQMVTATGRLSCQNPNLQNIPIRTETGRKIREAFCPEKSLWSYLSGDYSQIELRLLAHFSEDPSLMEAFQEGEDIHVYTASRIFNVPIAQITKEQRHCAKAVNFGIIYGQQAYGLSQEIGVNVREAAAFIERYFERFGRVKEYTEECMQRVRDTGRAITFTGRERLIPEIHSKNMQIRSAAERLAVNTPLQGGAADLIKMAMLSVQDALKEKRLKSLMILQIHDELLFEVPHDEVSVMQELVKEHMQNVLKLKVPLVVDILLGKNWAAC